MSQSPSHVGPPAYRHRRYTPETISSPRRARHLASGADIASFAELAGFRRPAETRGPAAHPDGGGTPGSDEATLDVRVRPLLRGVLHQWAAVLAVSLGIVLIALAHSERARLAAVVYGIGLTGCLGVSAAYHRGRWSARVKSLLCRIDHSTIFVLIAGTATPIVLLTLNGVFGNSLLLVEWLGAGGGIGVALLWRRPPVWLEVAPYLVLGWLGLLTVPALVGHMGATGLLLLVGGGVLYSMGAVVYALERPNPWPSVFGFHEVFHVFVTAAAGTHAVLMSLLVLSS